MARKKSPSAEKSSALPAKVVVEASAKISARAKYEVKKTIHQVIPEDVTRARTSAWLSIISPVTEWAGLKADQLVHKRQLLRLQQEETLYEVVSRAKTRLSEMPIGNPQIPLKFLVPFLEKASLENVNSDLVDLWANLLVSAAENYDPHYVHFASIISQMSAQQANLFAKILGTEDAKTVELAMDSVNSEYLHNFMQEHLAYEFKRLSNKKPKDLDEMWGFIDKALDIVGIEIEHVEVDDTQTGDYTNGPISVSSYEDDLETDFAILDATRLVRYIDTGFFDLSKRWRIKVMFYYVTPLGRSFAEACKIIK